MRTQNLYLFGAMALSLLLTTLVIYVPFLSTVFEFEHISFVEYLVSMAMAVSIIPIVEIIKLVQRARRKAR